MEVQPKKKLYHIKKVQPLLGNMTTFWLTSDGVFPTLDFSNAGTFELDDIKDLTELEKGWELVEVE